MPEPNSSFPRSHRMSEWTPAEAQIAACRDTVERLGAHPLLTESGTLLGQAQAKLAEWVDLQLAEVVCACGHKQHWHSQGGACFGGVDGSVCDCTLFRPAPNGEQTE